MQGRLTKRWIDSLQPGLHEIFIWDGELKGFGLRLSPTGRRTFVCQYRIQGRTRRYAIGPYGALTPAQARTEAAKILVEVAKGNDPAGAKRTGRKDPTLAQVAERYLKEHAEPKKKASSVATDRWLLSRLILPALGSKKIASISRADVGRFHHGLKSRPINANRCLSLLSKVFSLSMDWGLLPEGHPNPARRIQRYKERKRERFLSTEELSRLGQVLAEVDKENAEWPTVVLAVRLLLLTGCRLSEVLNLRWTDLNLEAGLIEIRDSKTGPKSLPLSGPVADILAEAPRLEGNDFICWGREPGGHLVGLQKPWARIRSRSGLPDVRLHDLRHSYASVATGAGLGLPIIGRLLGHTQAQTTQRYVHLGDDPLRAASEEVGRRLAEAMSKRPAKKIIPFPRK